MLQHPTKGICGFVIDVTRDALVAIRSVALVLCCLRINFRGMRMRFHIQQPIAGVPLITLLIVAVATMSLPALSFARGGAPNLMNSPAISGRWKSRASDFGSPPLSLT